MVGGGVVGGSGGGSGWGEWWGEWLGGVVGGGVVGGGVVGGGGRESPLPDSTMRWLQRRIAILDTFNLRN